MTDDERRPLVKCFLLLLVPNIHTKYLIYSTLRASWVFFFILMMLIFLCKAGQITTSWQSGEVPFNLPFSRLANNKPQRDEKAEQLTARFLFFLDISFLENSKTEHKTNICPRSAGLSQTWNQMNSNVLGIWNVQIDNCLLTQLL